MKRDRSKQAWFIMLHPELFRAPEAEVMDSLSTTQDVGNDRKPGNEADPESGVTPGVTQKQ